MTAANSIASIIPNLTMYYDDPAYLHGAPPSSQTISQLGTFPSLFIGIGAILCVIAAQVLGTRPVMIFEAALTVACIVWSAVSKGKDRGLYSHIASRCILGLDVEAAESLVPLIMQDQLSPQTQLQTFFDLGIWRDHKLGDWLRCFVHCYRP